MKKMFSLILLAAMYAGVPAQNVITFEGSDAVYVNGISSDGKYVTGQIKEQPKNMFVWTAEEGIDEWDATNVNSLGRGSTGKAVSITGRVVGQSGNPEVMVNSDPYDENSPEIPFQMAAYTDYSSETWHFLPMGNTQNPAYGYWAFANAISDDGTKIAGGGHKGGQLERTYAAWWDVSNPEAPVMHTLKADEVGRGSEVLAMSGNGSVMGGYIGTDFAYTPVLWIDGEQTALTGCTGQGRVYGISNNGSYAVTAVNNKAGFYDIEAGTYAEIEAGNSFAVCVSNTGIAGGFMGTKLPGAGAFLFTQATGKVNLVDFLNSNDVEYPEGFSFLSITGITADGSKICGIGKTQDSKTVGFVASIPPLSGELYPVEIIATANPSFGRIEISWEAPTESSATLTGYNVYCNSELLQTVNAATPEYAHTGLAEGTYTYKVTAVYGTDESRESKSVTVVMAKRSMPFNEIFSQPSLASTGWDVTANTVPISESWRLGNSGLLAPCALFFPPASGAYNESLTSPFLDATETGNLTLRFNMTTPSYNTDDDRMKVEIYDGTAWHVLDDMAGWGLITDGFLLKEYDASVAAGKNDVRVRFTCYGPNGSKQNWNIDNVELADDDNLFVPQPASAIAAAKDREKEYVFVNWVDPSGFAQLRYLYTDQWTAGSTGNEGNPFIAANMFMPADLQLFEDYKLTTLSFMLSNNITENAEYKWYVMQNGERVYSEAVDATGAGANEWVTVTLQTPLEIDVNTPLYTGVEVVQHGTGDTPIATSDIVRMETNEGGANILMSMDVADGRGNLYSTDNGETWETLKSYVDPEYGMTVYQLFCIKATVAKDPLAEKTEKLMGYQVLRNGVNILAQQYGDERQTLTGITGFIDAHPLPIGEQACYEVRAQYRNLLKSEEITACYTVNPVITASVTGEGTVSPSGETTVAYGEAQTFTFTSSEGYTLNKVLVDGVNNPAAVTAGSYTFTDVTANHTIAGEFVESSAIADVKNSTFAVSPNPVVSGQMLSISVNESGLQNSIIKLYSTAGVLVKEIRSTDKITPVTMDVVPGVYVLKVNNSKLKVVVK